MEIHAVANDLLRDIGRRLQASRSYVIQFRGENMTNSHEWTDKGVKAFKSHLTGVSVDALPTFVENIKKGKAVEVASVADIEADAPLEAEEMRLEDIQSLVMVPLKDPLSADCVNGFLGVDYCSGNGNAASKPAELRSMADFLMTISSMLEMTTGQLMMRNDVSNATTTYRADRTARLMDKLAASAAQWRSLWTLPSLVSFQNEMSRFLSTPPVPTLALPARDLYSRVKNERHTVVMPAEWVRDGVSREDLASFASMCAEDWGRIVPDIEPYTSFRDVAYARFMYRQGSVHSLKFKPFFQVKPEYNVIVGSDPRPFDRIPDRIRDSPVLRSILQTLLEDVWGGELGPEVHIGVHPTRVRNFHKDEIHNRLHATLEGTHVDSTHRVAVMMIERHNVGAGGTTSLYSADCPMGLLRERPEDEEVLRKYRLASHTLKQPLEALTFSDTEFKHDASNFLAADPSKKAWRSLMLIMCRTPNPQKSPTDGRILDGFTPRSEAGD